MGQMHTNPMVLKPHSPDLTVKGDLPQGATIKSPKTKTKTSTNGDLDINSSAGRNGANLGAGANANTKTKGLNRAETVQSSNAKADANRGFSVAPGVENAETNQAARANAQSRTNTKATTAPIVLKPHSPDLDVNGNLPQGATIQSPKTKTSTNGALDINSSAGKNGANLGAGANTQTQMNNTAAAGSRNVGVSANTSGRASSNNTMNVTPANANINSSSHASVGARVLTKLHLRKSH